MGLVSQQKEQRQSVQSQAVYLDEHLEVILDGPCALCCAIL
jgi:hypothetical protein